MDDNKIQDGILEQIEYVKQEASTFSPDEERRLIRKLDLQIIPLLMITYFLQSYDKAIISSATQFNFNTDLGLTTIVGHTASGAAITDSSKYANASMIFFCGYLAGTYPMIFLCQRFQTTRVVSLATFIWGGIVMSTAGCTNYSGILANRFFLGFFESAIAPAFTVYVTFWWTREEQVFRTGLWYCCVGIATTVSPLINWGLGQINSSLKPWQPMFLILGALTSAWSIVLWFALPANPLSTTRLNEQERRIAINRLERNNAGTVTQTFDKKQFWEAFLDYKTWSSAAIILCISVPTGALGNFGTLVISGFGYSRFDSLALSCPLGGIITVSILLVTYVTRKRRNTRYLFIITASLISLAGTCVCWFAPRNKNVLYAGLLLLSVQVCAASLAISLAGSNTAGHTKKSTVSASTFVGYCIGNIIGPILFGASPGPYYTTGFLGSFVCLLCVAVIAAVTAIILRRENRKRDSAAGGSLQLHSVDENLTDKQNENFRYIL